MNSRQPDHEGHFWDAGTEVPDHLVPDWARSRASLRRRRGSRDMPRREELRAEARERREKAEAKREAKANSRRQARQEAS